MKEKAIFVYVAILLLFYTIVYIYVVNNINLAGSDLRELQAHIDQVKKENLLLQEQVYLASSLTTIASISAAKGFIPATKTAYIYLK